MGRRLGLHPDERVSGAHADGGRDRSGRQRLTGHEAAHRLAQMGQAGLVDGLTWASAAAGSVKPNGSDERGWDGHVAIVVPLRQVLGRRRSRPTSIATWPRR